MMKNFYKDKELLSAYIDGELSPKEKEYIEEKISSSLELQKQLADMKRLKELTSASFERIPEAPFFQTRLSAELSASKPIFSKAKKWIPAFALTLVTAALMISLKFYPDLIKDVIEEQKSNLAALYKENLQPLLFAANLTNEDIFNFAFNSELPLDKTDQHFLKLGYDPDGKEYFEIKKSTSSVKENKFENFIQALDLDEVQRKEMDSIIASYSDELMAQVLVSDKNAIAISPNLWNYQKAIAADLLAFARSKNANVYNTIVTSPSKGNEFLQLARHVRDNRPTSESRYIFFTPDTIFTDVFEFDEQEFKKDILEMEKELAEMNKNFNNMSFQMRFDTNFRKLEKDSVLRENFSIHIEADKFRVNIPKIVTPDMVIQIPDMDSLNAVIKDALKNVEVYVSKHPDKPTVKRKFKVEVHSGDSTGYKSFNFNENKIDSLMKKFFNNPDSLRNFNFDSFNFFGDSLFFNQNEELRKQMNELKEEMRRFREEMHNLQIDPPAQPDTVKPKLRGIEI
jgi:hypothetical protein